jgi:hypothetical protein
MGEYSAPGRVGQSGERPVQLSLWRIFNHLVKYLTEQSVSATTFFAGV